MSDFRKTAKPDNSLRAQLKRAHDTIREQAAEIARLRAALKPFALAHGMHYPYSLITLHDLRMAHEAIYGEKPHGDGGESGE